MQELEELLQKPEIYQNLSLFKDFLKGVKKLCDQFEEKIKMIPKEEQNENEDDIKRKKRIEKQILKKQKQRSIQKQQMTSQKAGQTKGSFEIEDSQIQKSRQLDNEKFDIQQLNQEFELDQNKKKQQKITKADIKREEEAERRLQDDDSFGGNIVQEYS
ncbi:unnamed protein product [Paramecium sonneborni]|uniref:Uncharacterized protein n=1 Tax=Paramecium sonneborni TaxID=65129 RepID=A0A8S1QIJ3_9CILI|nr:unnamed protein product [Paramecium sonneborni]